jgi:hypothetical protein
MSVGVCLLAFWFLTESALQVALPLLVRGRMSHFCPIEEPGSRFRCESTRYPTEIRTVGLRQRE